MKQSKILLTAALSFCLCHAHAQTDSTKLFQKIEKLLVALDVPVTMNNNADTSAVQSIRNFPMLEAKRESVLAFFRKYMGWNALKTDVCRTYAKYYTATDIDELNRFYSTSTGKKSLTAAGNIGAELNQVAAKHLQEHISEINSLMQASTPGNPGSMASRKN